jgi:hypothetical protein
LKRNVQAYGAYLEESETCSFRLEFPGLPKWGSILPSWH